MSLHNLTASGWVLFGFTAVAWLGFVANIIALAKRGTNPHVGNSAVCTAILTVWLLWLVTP